MILFNQYCIDIVLGDMIVKNNVFSDISKAEEMAQKFKTILLVVMGILTAVFVIGGICFCVLIDVIIGMAMLLFGIIIGVLGIFGAYFLYQLLFVLLDAMRDVKLNRIANESKLSNNAQQTQNVDEARELYYLLFVEQNAYLYIDQESPDVLKATRSLRKAMSFDSEEEALKYAEQKGLNLNERWKIVKKKNRFLSMLNNNQ